MERGGRVFDHIGIGPLRFRIHIRLWKPMLLFQFGLRGHNVHGIYLGKY